MRTTLLLAPVFLLAAPLALRTPAPATTCEELRSLETFDKVWNTVDRQHFDPDYNGVDWDAEKDEYRPRAAQAETVEELREIIREMLAHLGQSHFELIPKEALGGGAKGSAASPAGTCGLDLRWLEGEAVIVRVDPDGAAALAGVQPGWVLRGIEETSLDELLAEAETGKLRTETAMWRALLGQVDGQIGTEVELAFEDREGTTREIVLERTERDAIPFDMPGLPTFFLANRWDIVEHDLLSIGILHFSNWFRPLLDPLDEALLEMRGCDGIVIDLRGNTGGDASVGTGLAGHFFEERVSLGKQRMRNGTVDFMVRPRRRFSRQRADPFTGPLAILVDETSGSCSEIFTGGMRALGRARVFGSRTTGAALPATLTNLPNGDSLMHAIAEFKTALGETLEGDGVEPDVEVLPRREDWAAGHDRTLEAALEWMAASR